MVYDKSSENPVYEEKLSSLRTEVLFVALALLFLALLAWRVMASGFGAIAAGLLFLFLLFSFCAAADSWRRHPSTSNILNAQEIW
jgi:hypothetical protein